MTLQEGNEPALPPADPTATATTPPETPAAPEPETVDVDLKELRDAIADAKAEEAATAAGTGGQQEAGTEPQTPAEQPADQGKPMPMIPKARLDEVLGERDKHLQEIAYWRGVAEGRGPVKEPGQPQEPQQPKFTPEQHLVAIRIEQQAIAKKFDDGEITMSDFVKQNNVLEDQAHGLREEALRSKITPAASDRNDDFGLAAETARLEDAHPWVKVLEKLPNNDADWNYLRGMAITNLASRGIDANAGKFGTYNLRREIAELADQLGPTLFGPRAQAAGIELPGTSQQPQKPALSPTAQARQAKLAQAEGAPPNVAGLTGTAPGTGTPSAAQLEEMSDDDIAKLPDAVRRKILGLT